MTYLLIPLCLVLCSAFFSAAETAFLSLNRSKINAMAEEGDKRARLAGKLHDDSDRVISTVLIGNTTVNIAAAVMGTVYFLRQYGSVGALTAAAVIILLILLFGEITPKCIAMARPEACAKSAAPLLRFLTVFLSPLNLLFSLWKKLLRKLLKLEGETKMSQEELLQLVDEVEEDGVINEEESELLHNAIEFSEMRADDILTHRVELEGVPVDADKAELARVFSETKFSRLLVYEESIDKIVGVVHLKDFYTGEGITPKSIEEIMTPPVFAMPAEKINDLLRRLQQNKSHVAVILDEYGGTLGIVTMEDILEELVGEIWDEHDEVVEEFEAVSETVALVSGSVALDEFCTRFEIEADTAESTTFGGWVAEQMGCIPETGAELRYENLIIRVTEVDSHRVEQAEVEVLPKEETEEE